MTKTTFKTLAKMTVAIFGLAIALCFSSCDTEDSSPTSEMIFYTTIPGIVIDVYVDGEFSGKVSTHSSLAPLCNDFTFPHKTLYPGTYLVEAFESGTKTLSGNIKIPETGKCYPIAVRK